VCDIYLTGGLPHSTHTQCDNILQGGLSTLPQQRRTQQAYGGAVPEPEHDVTWHGTEGKSRVWHGMHAHDTHTPAPPCEIRHPYTPRILQGGLCV
jgi:hypothetical protein